MARTVWTAMDQRILEKMASEGKTSAYIAGAMGRRFDTIVRRHRAVCVKLGIPFAQDAAGAMVVPEPTRPVPISDAAAEERRSGIHPLFREVMYREGRR